MRVKELPVGESTKFPRIGKPRLAGKSEPVPMLSVVIPVYNEEEVIEATYRTVKTQLDRIGETYELIFVDDGSTDRSRELLQKIAALDSLVVVVMLSRNFGHEMATTAGLKISCGKAAVIIDADLQDPPEVIEEFLAKWKEGYDVVYGVRKSRQGEGWPKLASAYLFYWIMAKISDVPFPKNTGDFRLLDRRVVDVYRNLKEDPRFFRGLISWIGYKQVGVPFVRQPRAAGTSKYRFVKLVKLALDTLTAFSTFPALAILFMAIGLAIVSTLFIGTMAVYMLLHHTRFEWWHWAIVGGVIISNFHFMSLAVLGQYIVRTHKNTQRRPLYAVDKIVRNSEEK